jgi:hypothetical protein
MIRALLIAAVFLGAAAPGLAAQRSFTVTSFDRIRVDGPYSVRLSTGVTPYARATGSARALDGTSVRVEGRTLTIRRDPSAWGGYPNQAMEPVELAIGTHELANASLNGAGTLSIDKVRGLTFELSAQGAGRADIGAVEVDRLVVSLSGTVTSRVAGKALKLTAIVRGASSLDATALSARDGLLSAQGPAQLSATVTETARVDATGVAQVTVAGKPACTVKLLGSSAVSGCEAKR